MKKTENKFFKSLACSGRLYTEVRVYGKDDEKIKIQILGKKINRDYGFSCELLEGFDDFVGALKEIFLDATYTSETIPEDSTALSLYEGSGMKYVVCQVRLKNNGKLKFQIPSKTAFNRGYGYTIEIGKDDSSSAKKMVTVLKKMVCNKK